MKVAALITAHNNPKCLLALLDALEVGQVDSYLLIDAKAKNVFDDEKLVKKVKVILPKMNIYWGGYSQIEGTMKLISAARDEKYDYYITLSGVDYPIKPIADLLDYLADCQHECISCEKMPSPTKQLYRLETLIFQKGNRARGYIDFPYQLINQLSRSYYQKNLYKRNYQKAFGRMVPYGGWTWWALSKNCINYIWNFIQNNPKYIKQFKYTFCADEIFIHTIIMNSPYREKVSQSLTHAVWNEPDRGMPAIVTVKHVKSAFLMNEIFFLRKFCDAEYDTLEYAKSLIS